MRIRKPADVDGAPVLSPDEVAVLNESIYEKFWVASRSRFVTDDGVEYYSDDVRFDDVRQCWYVGKHAVGDVVSLKTNAVWCPTTNPDLCRTIATWTEGRPEIIRGISQLELDEYNEIKDRTIAALTIKPRP